VFRDAELEYLTSGRRLGRIATVGRDGIPHVVPVGWSYDPAGDVIEVGGFELAKTKKFRDVRAMGRAAIVIDDLASVDPWRPRGVEVRGRAHALAEPSAVIRIEPERIISWGLESERHARDV
jgi:pyridoxamine 5'-phosphate oxidase family protein